MDSLVGIVLIISDWNAPLPYSIRLWEYSIVLDLTVYVVAIILAIRVQFIGKSEMVRIAIIPFIFLTILNMVLGYSEQCQIFGVVDTKSGDVVHDARTCFYFSLVTWTTVGYGDFRPMPALRLIAASEALLGYLSMALFVGGVIYVMGSRDEPKR